MTMANQISGAIIRICPTVQVPTKSGNIFSRREIILDCSFVGRNGETYPNPISITFTQDRCALLDAFAPGQQVTVSFDLRGRYHQPSDRYFNDIQGWKIEASVQGQQPYAPAPQQTQYAPAPAPQQPQYAAPQQPQYTQAPNTQPQYAPAPAQPQYAPQQPQYAPAPAPQAPQVPNYYGQAPAQDPPF